MRWANRVANGRNGDTEGEPRLSALTLGVGISHLLDSTLINAQGKEEKGIFTGIFRCI